MQAIPLFVRAPHRFSLKSLLGFPLKDLVQEIAIRSNHQYNILTVYPELQPISILKSLYGDTSSSLLSISDLNDRTGAHLVDKDVQSRILSSKLKSLESRHCMVTETLSDAYIAVKKAQRSEGYQSKSHPISDNIDQILRRQTGISMLLQHTVGLTSPKSSHSKGCVENYDVKKLCEDVRIEATNLAEHHFNWSPEVVITTNKTSDQIQLWMIPYFGRFILLEVLKNALYATALKFMDDNNIVKSSLVDPDIVSSAPPVRLSITSSTEGVRVCVADSGGGMSDETVRNATKFLWASTLQASDLVKSQTSYQPAPAPLRGLGAGLCLSNIFATHFGGSLAIESGGIGKGTTVTLFIPRSTDILEAQ